MGSVRPGNYACQATPWWHCTLLCVLLAVAYGPLPVLAAGEWLAKGNEALGGGRLREAIEFFTMEIKQHPDNALPYVKRAAAHEKLRKKQDAIRDLETAAQLDPSSTSTLIKKARLYRDACRFDDATVDLNSVLQKRPEHKAATKELEQVREAQTLLGEVKEMVHVKGAREDIVSQMIDRVLAVAPECTEARLLGLRGLVARGDHERVLAETTQLLMAGGGGAAGAGSLGAADLDLLVMRGQAFWHTGETESAIQHFQKVLRADPEHRSAKDAYRTARAFTKQRTAAEAAERDARWDDAIKAWSRLEESTRDGSYPEGRKVVLTGLCRALTHARQPGAGARRCQEARELDAGYTPAIVAHVRALIASEEYDAAVREANAAAQAEGADAEMQELLREAQAALRRSKVKDYFGILGLSRAAQPSDREIKRAYRALSLKFHPDKQVGKSEAESEEAERRFRELTEAYEVLTDPEKRAKYDQGIDPNDQSQGGGGGQHRHPFQHGSPFGFGGGPFTFHFRAG
ncbi:unnamed protein product [Pedinophyceae sp. YPF-701]|nr:unnamed protein product [Pedinophyceae sp. YPF-701]